MKADAIVRGADMDTRQSRLQQGFHLLGRLLLCESNLVYNPEKQGGVVDDGGALGLGNAGLEGANRTLQRLKLGQEGLRSLCAGGGDEVGDGMLALAGFDQLGFKGADFFTAVVRFAQGELICQLAGLGQSLTFGGDCVQHGENSVLELLFAGGGDAFIFADVIGDPLFIG